VAGAIMKKCWKHKEKCRQMKKDNKNGNQDSEN
jgi:hypothetical protein